MGTINQEKDLKEEIKNQNRIFARLKRTFERRQKELK